MVGGGRPLLNKIWGHPAPGGAKSPILNRSASAVTPSEKVQLTLIGSPLRGTR